MIAFVLRIYAALLVIVASLSAQPGPDQPKFHVDSMSWIYRELYSGGTVFPYITGTLANESAVPLSAVTVTFNLYAYDDSVVGNAFDFVQVVPPGGRWRFSASLPVMGMVAPPIYAKAALVTFIVPLDDGRPFMWRTTVTDSPQVWNPEELQRKATAEAKRLKEEEKARKKAEKKAKHDKQPSP